MLFILPYAKSHFFVSPSLWVQLPCRAHKTITLFKNPQQNTCKKKHLANQQH